MNALLQDYLQDMDTVGEFGREPRPRMRAPRMVLVSDLGDYTARLERSGASPDYVRQFNADICRVRNHDAAVKVLRRYFELE